jgi:hypothetical protein
MQNVVNPDIGGSHMDTETQRLVLMILLPILPLVTAGFAFLAARRLGRREHRDTSIMLGAEEAKDLYRRVCNAIRRACDSDDLESKEGTDFILEVGPSIDLLPAPIRPAFYAWVDAAADMLIHPDRSGGAQKGIVSFPSTVESERHCRGSARDAILQYERTGR